MNEKRIKDIILINFGAFLSAFFCRLSSQTVETMILLTLTISLFILILKLNIESKEV